MSDRDWEKELRKIDEQMERAPRQPEAPPAAVAPPRVSAPIGGVAAAGSAHTTGFGVYARLALATALAVGIAFWPYGARCGLGLAAYLAAVGAVMVGGVWSAVWTWRHRSARAHLLSLLLVLWGLLLASIDILPRAGYAIPTIEHAAAWRCS